MVVVPVAWQSKAMDYQAPVHGRRNLVVSAQPATRASRAVFPADRAEFGSDTRRAGGGAVSAATACLAMTTRDSTRLPEPTGPAVDLRDGHGRIQARYYPLHRAVVIIERRVETVHRLAPYDSAIDAGEQAC